MNIRKKSKNQTNKISLNLTRTRKLVWDTLTSELRVDSAVVRDLESLLAADDHWLTNVQPVWSFYRIRSVRIEVVPRHKYPYQISGTTYDGSNYSLVVSAGHDYSQNIADDNNVVVADICEMPGSKLLHSFERTTLSRTISDTKWYPTETDQTTTTGPTNYYLFLLYSMFEVEEGATTVASLNIHFDIELKGLRI